MLQEEKLPGGFQLIEMEYLQAKDGWLSLHFISEEAVLTDVQAALAKVHRRGLVLGNCRPNNVMVRWVSWLLTLLG